MAWISPALTPAANETSSSVAFLLLLPLSICTSTLWKDFQIDHLIQQLWSPTTVLASALIVSNSPPLAYRRHHLLQMVPFWCNFRQKKHLLAANYYYSWLLRCWYDFRGASSHSFLQPLGASCRSSSYCSTWRILRRGRLYYCCLFLTSL